MANIRYINDINDLEKSDFALVGEMPIGQVVLSKISDADSPNYGDYEITKLSMGVVNGEFTQYTEKYICSAEIAGDVFTEYIRSNPGMDNTLSVENARYMFNTMGGDVVTMAISQGEQNGRLGFYLTNDILVGVDLVNGQHGIDIDDYRHSVPDSEGTMFPDVLYSERGFSQEDIMKIWEVLKDMDMSHDNIGNHIPDFDSMISQEVRIENLGDLHILDVGGNREIVDSENLPDRLSELNSSSGNALSNEDLLKICEEAKNVSFGVNYDGDKYYLLECANSDCVVRLTENEPGKWDAVVGHMTDGRFEVDHEAGTVDSGKALKLFEEVDGIRVGLDSPSIDD